MGEYDGVGRSALAIADRVDDVLHDDGHQPLGGVGGVLEDDRCVVPEAALELLRKAGRLLAAAANSGVANQQRSVVVKEHGRGNRRGMVAEPDDLDPSVTRHCRRRERRPEVDPQRTPHPAADSTAEEP